MFLQLALMSEITCSVVVQDSGPTPRNGVLLRLTEGAPVDVTYLRPILESEQVIFLDPVVPRISILANRNDCYAHWPGEVGEDNADKRVVSVTPGAHLALKMPRFDARPERGVEEIVIALGGVDTPSAFGDTLGSKDGDASEQSEPESPSIAAEE